MDYKIDDRKREVLSNKNERKERRPGIKIFFLFQLQPQQQVFLLVIIGAEVAFYFTGNLLGTEFLCLFPTIIITIPCLRNFFIFPFVSSGKYFSLFISYKRTIQKIAACGIPKSNSKYQIKEAPILGSFISSSISFVTALCGLIRKN